MDSAPTEQGRAAVLPVSSPHRRSVTLAFPPGRPHTRPVPSVLALVNVRESPENASLGHCKACPIKAAFSVHVPQLHIANNRLP